MGDFAADNVATGLESLGAGDIVVVARPTGWDAEAPPVAFVVGVVEGRVAVATDLRLNVDVVLDADGDTARQLHDLWTNRLQPWAAAMSGVPVPSGPAVLSPYQFTWPAAAARRIVQLRAALRGIEGSEHWSIEHIGSTAVAGLAAKPFLDIQIAAPSIPPAPLLDDLLRDVGYLPAKGSRPDSPGVYRDSPRGSCEVADEVWAKRLFFSPDPIEPSILHVRQAVSPFGRYTLWFRDWLRANPVERDRYQRVKAELAVAHARDADYDDYTRAKTAYLDKVQDRFEAWGRLRTGAPPTRRDRP